MDDDTMTKKAAETIDKEAGKQTAWTTIQQERTQPTNKSQGQR